MKTLKNLLTIGILCFPLYIACNNSTDANTNSEQKKEDVSMGSSNSNTSGRYGIESGIVTSETMLPNNMGKTTTIQYFKDYGGVERTEIISLITAGGQNIKSTSHSLMEGSTIYNWEEGATTGTKIVMDMIQDISKMNYREMSAELKQQFNIKEEGKNMANGKNCDTYSIDYLGSKGKVYIWEGITMKSEMAMAGMNVEINVVDLQENANIDGDKFKVPSNITFTEVTMPGKK